MTVQAWETRRRTARSRRVLTAVLAVATLVPLGVLFFDHSSHQGERRSVAAQERHGVEYLVGLSQLTIVLNDARAAAVSGEEFRWELLDEAMAEVTEVDERYGEELRVGERWPTLRNVIEQAAGTEHADGPAAYAAYEEATGLLLGLHDRVRDTTGLVRDPEPDVFHLQNAAGGALPETTVEVGQLVDQITIADGATASDPATSAAGIRAAMEAATRSADELVVSVQEALDTTKSRSLSSTVLSKYDRFLRGKDILLSAVPPDGNVEAADVELITFMRGEVQAAAEELSIALLTELDVLVDTRLGTIVRGQRITIAAGLLGVLLVLGLVAVTLLWEPRRPVRRLGELPSGSGSGGDGGGPGRGAPELPPVRTPISEAAAGYGARPDLPAPGDRLAGDVLGAERANVR